MKKYFFSVYFLLLTYQKNNFQISEFAYYLFSPVCYLLYRLCEDNQKEWNKINLPKSLEKRHQEMLKIYFSDNAIFIEPYVHFYEVSYARPSSAVASFAAMIAGAASNNNNNNTSSVISKSILSVIIQVPTGWLINRLINKYNYTEINENIKKFQTNKFDSILIKSYFFCIYLYNYLTLLENPTEKKSYSRLSHMKKHFYRLIEIERNIYETKKNVITFGNTEKNALYDYLLEVYRVTVNLDEINVTILNRLATIINQADKSIQSTLNYYKTLQELIKTTKSYILYPEALIGITLPLLPRREISFKGIEESIAKLESQEIKFKEIIDEINAFINKPLFREYKKNYETFINSKKELEKNTSHLIDKIFENNHIRLPTLESSEKNLEEIKNTLIEINNSIEEIKEEHDCISEEETNITENRKIFRNSFDSWYNDINFEDLSFSSNSRYQYSIKELKEYKNKLKDNNDKQNIRIEYVKIIKDDLKEIYAPGGKIIEDFKSLKNYSTVKLWADQSKVDSYKKKFLELNKKYRSSCFLPLIYDNKDNYKKKIKNIKNDFYTEDKITFDKYNEKMKEIFTLEELYQKKKRIEEEYTKIIDSYEREECIFPQACRLKKNLKCNYDNYEEYWQIINTEITLEEKLENNETNKKKKLDIINQEELSLKYLRKNKKSFINACTYWETFEKKTIKNPILQFNQSQKEYLIKKHRHTFDFYYQNISKELSTFESKNTNLENIIKNMQLEEMQERIFKVAEYQDEFKKNTTAIKSIFETEMSSMSDALESTEYTDTVIKLKFKHKELIVKYDPYCIKNFSTLIDRKNIIPDISTIFADHKYLINEDEKKTFQMVVKEQKVRYLHNLQNCINNLTDEDKVRHNSKIALLKNEILEFGNYKDPYTIKLQKKNITNLFNEIKKK